MIEVRYEIFDLVLAVGMFVQLSPEGSQRI